MCDDARVSSFPRAKDHLRGFGQTQGVGAGGVAKPNSAARPCCELAARVASARVCVLLEGVRAMQRTL
jgi:hypothetical protein